MKVYTTKKEDFLSLFSLMVVTSPPDVSPATLRWMTFNPPGSAPPLRPPVVSWQPLLFSSRTFRDINV